MRFFFIHSCFLIFLSSCGIYRSSFDCPAGKGIGCARVDEVLDMIVERDSGEDLFITDSSKGMSLKFVEGLNGELVLEETNHSDRNRKKRKKKQNPEGINNNIDKEKSDIDRKLEDNRFQNLGQKSDELSIDVEENPNAHQLQMPFKEERLHDKPCAFELVKDEDGVLMLVKKKKD